MKRLLLALLLFTHAAFAGPQGAGYDPYFIETQSFAALNPWLDSNALSQTAPQTVDITKTNLILIAAGQSNMANVAPSVFSPVNASSLFQLNIYDGKIYPAADPELGTTPINVSGFIGNPALRIADTLITNGNFQRVYLVPIAIGSTAVADWATGPEAQILPVVFLRLTQKGIVAGANVTIAVIWGQGENDNTLATSQANYAAGLTTVINQSRTAGFAGKWFIAKQTFVNGTTSAAVQAAQVAAPNGTTIFAGPNADALTGSVCGAGANIACRKADNLHWSDAGSFSYAAAWITALHASGAPF